MPPYLKRIIDRELDELFPALSALAIEGLKAVGKTETATRRANSIIRLDDEGQRQIAEADPLRVLQGEGPILLDEWQHAPAVWNAVRRAVDDGQPPGPFLLTGSAVPRDGEAPERHSGAGRIDTLRMRPMTLPERLQSRTTVSLSDLLEGNEPEIKGKTAVDLETYTNEIVSSGFPAIRELSGRPLRRRLASYTDNIVDRDFEIELGEKVRRPEALKRWMAAYAAATGMTTTKEKIRKAAVHDGTNPSRPTVGSYQEALRRLYMLDPVPGWTPSFSRLSRLTRQEKHHLADPALAVSLLGLTKSKLLEGEGPNELLPRDGAFLGALFESLATLSIRVFAQAADAEVYHLREQDGRHEIDLIVEGGDGNILAIEVKLSGKVDDGDVKHLNWLQKTIGNRFRDGLIVTTGDQAYRRVDGVAVVPLALLGP